MGITDDLSLKTTMPARAAGSITTSNQIQENELLKRQLLISLNQKLDALVEISAKQIEILNKILESKNA